jgi:hypothetical protein
MEPQLKTVKNYYQEKSQNNLRIKEFDTTNSIKLSEDIKELVRVQKEVIKIVDKQKLVIHKDSYAAHRFAYYENLLDNEYRKLVEFYLSKGLKANRKDFIMLEEDRSDKAGLKFNDLLNKARSETKSAIKEDEYLARNKGMD